MDGDSRDGVRHMAPALTCSMPDSGTAIAACAQAAQRPMRKVAVAVNTSELFLQETPLHYDSMDNFFCQVAGTKYIRLYSHEQTPMLYVAKGEPGSSKRTAQGNVSSVCVEHPDLDRHPRFAKAKFTHSIMQPGDMLFIPARCWHYVRSLSTSISVNFWF